MKTHHKIIASIAIAGAITAGVVSHTGAPTRVSSASDIYPSAQLTPGTINPDITQANIAQNICNPAWSTKSERPASNYTTGLKIKQIVQYGYKDTATASYEEDHLISLELGGNPTDPNNLWPEPYTASIADGGARIKDKVENYLHAQVCAGTITLEQAQHEVSTDWYAVWQSMQKSKSSDQTFGGTLNMVDRDDESGI